MAAALAALALAASGATATVAMLPLAPASEPDEEHMLAESLCRAADDAAVPLLSAAAVLGVAPLPHDVPGVRVGVPLEDAMLELYDRLDVTLAVEEREALAAQVEAMPPASRAPVAVLVTAIVDATDLNARALAPLTPEDHAVIESAMAQDREALLRDEAPAPWPAEAQAAALKVDTRLQVAATLLLLEAVEVAEPMVHSAVGRGEWPRESDPLPFSPVFVGSMGDDVVTTEKVLVVDPAGSDQYSARIAGGAPLHSQWRAPVAVAFEIDGDDTYYPRAGRELAAGTLGVGVLIDRSGHDTYRAASYALGSGDGGVGLFYDGHGNDRYEASFSTLGYAVTGVGIALERAGDDIYGERGNGLGFGNGNRSIGFFCDIRGADAYTADARSVGSAYDPLARGWFVDLGGAVDNYSVRPLNDGPHPSGNDRFWVTGGFGGAGHGQDS